MDYLVFDTEAEALAAEQLIFSRGAEIAAGLGRTVDDDGIVSRRNGQDAPTAARTTRWDVPRQRLDGKWVIAHPSNHPLAGEEISEGVTYLDYAMAGVTAPTEEEIEDWWPSSI